MLKNNMRLKWNFCVKNVEAVNMIKINMRDTRSAVQFPAWAAW